MVDLTNLWISLENLHEDFGSTENPLLGFAINFGLAAIGIVIYLELNGIVAIAGLAWALINLSGIAKWVIGG